MRRLLRHFPLQAEREGGGGERDKNHAQQTYGTI